MNERQTKQKKLKSILIVLGVIIMPVIFRLLDSGALQSIRNIDIAMIFGLGFAAGVFLLTLKGYLRLKNKD